MRAARIHMPFVAFRALSAAALLAGAAARADDIEQLQRARTLFAQAEKDEDADRWSEALEKLHRVADVRRTAGVRYHIALCEEHLGHLATALAEYTAANDQARVEGAGDVLRLVGKQVAALSPRVPHLTIHILPEGVNATVTLDGAAVRPDRVEAPLPVDPGEHRVEATAPGRVAAGATVSLREHDATILDLMLSEATAFRPPLRRGPGRSRPCTPRAP
jgi:hypothetical protein